MLFGVMGGFAIVAVVNRLRTQPGLTPVVVMAMAVAVYALTNTVGASGFLAAYLAGLVAGNARLQSAGALRRFQDGVTWLAQIAMFVTLGLLATPRQFPAMLSTSALLAGVLIFVARPVAVFLCLLPFRFSMRRARLHRLGGLARRRLDPARPGAAARRARRRGRSVRHRLHGRGRIAGAARLDRAAIGPRSGPDRARPAVPVHRMEIDLPGLADHEIVAYPLPPESPLARGRDLPRWARPILVRREGQAITAPRQLMAGDQVYFLATPPQIPLLDKLLAGTPDESEAEATLYGDFTIEPAATFAALRETYGLPKSEVDETATIANLFEREFGTDLEQGDRLHLGSIDLIVRDIRDGKIVSVGIALEPEPRKGFWQRARSRLGAFLRTG